MGGRPKRTWEEIELGVCVGRDLADWPGGEDGHKTLAAAFVQAVAEAQEYVESGGVEKE